MINGDDIGLEPRVERGNGGAHELDQDLADDLQQGGVVHEEGHVILFKNLQN